MRGLYFDGMPRLRHDLPCPEPRPGEALLRIRLAGICRTDVEILKGYVPFRGILGHEFVADVVAAPGHPAWVGCRVTGEINIPCGQCPTCRRQLTMHCPQRQAIGIRGHDGSLAEYLCLPIANLHRVPDELDDQEAVFTEPLAAALAIPDLYPVSPSQRVAVVGDGKLGLLVAQVLALTGASVTVIGRHPQRLAWLSPMAFHDGATATSLELDLVVECSGSPQGLATAMFHVRPRGLVVLKSSFHGQSMWPGHDLMVREITLAGSRCGPFPPALRLLTQKAVVTQPFIHGIHGLHDMEAAIQAAQQPGIMKILVSMA